MTDNPITRLEGHRFGEEGGADPHEAQQAAAPPWSIRGAIRRIGALTRAELEELANDPRLTMAQLVAIKKYMLATGKSIGSGRAMDKLEESVDGKLVETKIEITTDSYADLVRQAADADKRQPS